jgi:hypothetical protein
MLLVDRLLISCLCRRFQISLSPGSTSISGSSARAPRPLSATQKVMSLQPIARIKAELRARRFFSPKKKDERRRRRSEKGWLSLDRELERKRHGRVCRRLLRTSTMKLLLTSKSTSSIISISMPTLIFSPSDGQLVVSNIQESLKKVLQSRCVSGAEAYLIMAVRDDYGALDVQGYV